MADIKSHEIPEVRNFVKVRSYGKPWKLDQNGITEFWKEQGWE
jgi:hypothetical protein